MSYSHSVTGWQQFDVFISALDVAEIPYTVEEKPEKFIVNELSHVCYCAYADEPDTHCPCCEETCEHIRHFRIARFTTLGGKKMVAEDYLECEDRDCDGVDVISLVVYEEGKRPELATKVLEAP